MATASFYLDTRRSKKDGTFPIKINVRHNNKFLVSTEFSATPETQKRPKTTKLET